MPIENLHMTALEIKHSVTAPEISALLETLEPKIEEITNFTYSHRSRLVRPMLSYDASAVALSFVPAAEVGDSYTYHELRRDLYNLCRSTGCEVASRYVVPSAHLTIARFVTQEDFEKHEGGKTLLDSTKMKAFVECIEQLNIRLVSTWASDASGTEWIVGQEKGLDCCRGTLWFGDAERVRLGKGFSS